MSNFSLMFIGYESFYCIITVQFPVLDFDLDHYGSEPLMICHVACLQYLCFQNETHITTCNYFMQHAV